MHRLLANGVAVLSADVFGAGEFVEDGAEPPRNRVDERHAGYTFCYSRPLLANRVRDVLTALAAAPRLVLGEAGPPSHPRPPGGFDLVGTGDAGPWVLLARALAGAGVARTLADLRGLGFARIASPEDPMMLPGALKYGGLGGRAALAAPADLLLAGTAVRLLR